MVKCIYRHKNSTPRLLGRRLSERNRPRVADWATKIAMRRCKVRGGRTIGEVGRVVRLVVGQRRFLCVPRLGDGRIRRYHRPRNVDMLGWICPHDDSVGSQHMMTTGEAKKGDPSTHRSRC
jgi:hypothetical protein